MNILQIIYEAFESIAANKLRSSLTVLGIVIGVASVISMLAIGRGASAQINNSINSLGSNLIYVSTTNQYVRTPHALTTSDVALLGSSPQASAISKVSGVMQGRSTVAVPGASVSTTVYGVDTAYAEMRDLTAAEGTLITDAALNNRTAVAVLGSTVAESLFGRTTRLVGETVRIQGQTFKVIGVLTSKGGSGFGNQDDQILVPITTAQSRLLRRTAKNAVDQIVVQATSSNTATEAVNQINSILAVSHHTTTDKPDVSTLNQQDILNTATSITGVLTVFLGGIGGISLLVGGIGIMNIMLVTVTERTREIGLRKALGARKLDILVQFLTESSVLSLMGGLIGLALAWGITTIIAQVAAQTGTTFTPLIQADAVLLATVFSAAVGLFFGFYPANRAANLQPVEALRYE